MSEQAEATMHDKPAEGEYTVPEEPNGSCLDSHILVVKNLDNNGTAVINIDQTEDIGSIADFR